MRRDGGRCASRAPSRSLKFHAGAEEGLVTAARAPAPAQRPFLRAVQAARRSPDQKHDTILLPSREADRAHPSTGSQRTRRRRGAQRSRAKRIRVPRTKRGTDSLDTTRRRGSFLDVPAGASQRRQERKKSPIVPAAPRSQPTTGRSCHHARGHHERPRCAPSRIEHAVRRAGPRAPAGRSRSDFRLLWLSAHSCQRSHGVQPAEHHRRTLCS